MRPELTSSRRGSALLLVLWSLILLSMSVFGVVEIVESSVSHATHLEQQSQARALAMSGLALALDPDMVPNDSLLKQKPATDQKWTVSLVGEGARLNLNQVLEDNHRDILVRLFVQWGLELGNAQHVADCLYDWISPGDKASPQGAKAADYQKAGMNHQPADLPGASPFTSLSEVSYVMGMDMVEKMKPNWQDSFTLWSDGPLDVNEASPELIAAVFNVPLSMTQSFVERRNGKDGVAETDDDVTLPDMATLKRNFGIGDKDAQAIATEVAFTDAVRRIKSRGESNGVAVTVSVVARLKSQPPEYLLWNEL